MVVLPGAAYMDAAVAVGGQYGRVDIPESNRPPAGAEAGGRFRLRTRVCLRPAWFERSDIRP